MARAAKASLEELSAAIEAIHEAALDDARWPDVLGLVGGFFRASMVTLWAEDTAGAYHDIGGTERNGIITQAYADYYLQLDMVHPVVSQASGGSIVTDAMVMPRRELERTEFYTDFANRHGIQSCMEARVTAQPDDNSYVTFTRSLRFGAFDTEDVGLLRLLMPHLRSALRTRRRLVSVAAEREAAVAAFDRLTQGVLVLDGDGQVLHANPPAEAILRAADGLVAVQGRLRAAGRRDDAALQHALAEAATEGGRTLAIGRSSGRAALVVAVQPLAAGRLPANGAWPAVQVPARLVFVIDPDADHGAITTRALRSAYGLTTAEAATAEAVARGLGTADAAEALQIAPSTLRWHLQRVFEKTGTGRQAELARLVARLGAVTPES